MIPGRVEVGDFVDGYHQESKRHVRGKVVKVLPGYNLLVEATERCKNGVPVGERVLLSGDDIND